MVSTAQELKPRPLEGVCLVLHLFYVTSCHKEFLRSHPRGLSCCRARVTCGVLLPFLGQLSGKQVLSPTSDERVKDEFSDLSEG